MIKAPHPIWRKFERDYIRNEPKGWHANIECFEDMIGWAEYLGALPLKDPLAGIEDDLRLAKALNVQLPLHSTDGSDRSGPE